MDIGARNCSVATVENSEAVLEAAVTVGKEFCDQAADPPIKVIRHRIAPRDDLTDPEAKERYDDMVFVCSRSISESLPFLLIFSNMKNI